jgi:hypothetical protein
MGTSGTGHDLCPSLVSRAHQASGPSCGGNWKIIKTAFGFKGVAKNIDPVLEAAECCRPCRCSAVAVASCRSPTRPNLAPGAEHLPVFPFPSPNAHPRLGIAFRRQCARRLGLRPSCHAPVRPLPGLLAPCRRPVGGARVLSLGRPPPSDVPVPVAFPPCQTRERPYVLPCRLLLGPGVPSPSNEACAA